MARGAGARRALTPSPQPAGPAGTYAAWLVAAVAVLGVVVSVGYSMRLQIRVADMETRLKHIVRRMSAADHAMANANRITANAKASLAVLTSPDVVSIELQGQSQRRQTSGRAFWSRTKGLVVVTPNRPALPEGQVYQVWLLTAQGPVSVGFLSTGTTEAFFAPGDIGSPAAIQVTVESQEGATAPFGDLYISGQLAGS